jgi:hypothetical protein
MAPDASGSGTEVTMHTSMNVTGRPAQFGRGVMVEVGGKLVDQFAVNLAQLIGGDTGGPGPAEGSPPEGAASSATAVPSAASGTDGTSAPAVSEAPNGNGSAAAGPVASTANGSVTSAPAPAPAPDDSLNLVKLVGPAVLKRLVPVAAGAAVLALLGRIFWRRRRAAKD